MVKFKKFPVIIEAEDYHNFSHFVDELRPLLDKKSSDIDYAELGCCYGTYVAILYSGKRPNKKVILKTLMKAGLIYFNDAKIAKSFLKNGNMDEI